MVNLNIALKKATKIKLLVLDVDGVLTDGKIYITDSGSESKAFNARDGVGMKMLLKSGVEIAIISGRYSKAVEHRMHGLGVKYIYQNQGNKLHALTELQSILNLQNDHVAYIGDDLPDSVAMQNVGFSVAVADANDHLKTIADWQTTLPGGRGAVREICDLIIQAQNAGGKA